jgi:hypothetical protein
VFCPRKKFGTNQERSKNMALISKVAEIVKREFKLEDYVANAIDNYARMIDSTPDHVVNSALKMTVFRDKEFTRWRKEQRGTTGERTGAEAPQSGAKP